MSNENRKIALVTGGGSGIGRSICETFALQGDQVIVSDRNVKAGEETVSLITEAGGEAIFIPCDVSQHDEVKALFEAAIAQFGAIHVAVNNAGVLSLPFRTADVTEEDYDRVMDINVKGTWLCMKYEIRQMIAQGGGSIVNIASVAGLIGSHSLPIYGASKHAVIGLTKSAALEYARKGVRVNAVCPAVIETPMMTFGFESNPAFKETAIQINPSRRLGRPEEVAAAVLWLASDASSFTTGAALTVDGGLTAQ